MPILEHVGGFRRRVELRGEGSIVEDLAAPVHRLDHPHVGDLERGRHPARQVGRPGQLAALFRLARHRVELRPARRIFVLEADLLGELGVHRDERLRRVEIGQAEQMAVVGLRLPLHRQRCGLDLVDAPEIVERRDESRLVEFHQFRLAVNHVDRGSRQDLVELGGDVVARQHLEDGVLLIGLIEGIDSRPDDVGLELPDVDVKRVGLVVLRRRGDRRRSGGQGPGRP